MKPRRINFSTYKTDIVELKRGINENVSSLELLAGELIDCKNYMIAEGGYGGYLSVPGYERFDGIIIPSKQESYVITLTDCSVEVLEGQLMTGGTSGATATALEDGRVLSGAYVDGDATVEIEALIANSNTFDPTEIVSTVSGAVGTLESANVIVGGNVDNHLALELYRSLVSEVPGEGNILGVHIFEGKAYAFRKKVGVDEIGFYEENSSTGWAEVDTSADPLTYDGTTGHIFKFSNYNFYSTVDTFTMYWVDGVNQCRSYDGTTVTTIDNTGMSVQSLDAPTDLATHNYHLFLGYRGGSLQYSVAGEPDNWDGVVGASEIGLGNTITNLIAGVGSSLVIFLTEGIRILNGNSIDDYNLEVFSNDSGAYSQTAKRLLGTVFFIDDRGLSTLGAVQEYGDYAANSISQRFKRTLLDKEHEVTECTVSRDLNLYRIFFDDRTGIYVSFEGREFNGATFVEFDRSVRIVSNGEDADRKDHIIWASDDETGYVYKMDSGTSFDGNVITCRMSTAYFHYGSPRRFKAFKRATLEIAGEVDQTFDLKVDFNYNELGNPRTIWYTPQIYTDVGTAVYSSSEWGVMKYGGAAVANRVPIYLQGVGTNMSYKVLSNETYRPQHIIQNIITDYKLIGRRI